MILLPSKLKLENFFSHRASEVDFSQFQSSLLVGNVDGDYGKSNGSGKSVIMQSILWCLYNKSRATSADDVIMWGEEKCVVSLDFIHDGKEYLIKRTRFRSTSTSTVELFVMGDDGKFTSLSGSTSGETNDRIVKLLKIDYKTFVNSTYFMQNDISEFATSEASKKKDILKSIVDLSKWDSFEKESKKRAKDLQTELIKLQSRYDALKSEVEVLAISESQLLLASESLEEQTRDKDLLQERLEIVSENYLKLKNNIDTDSWDRATSDIVMLKSQGKDLRQRFDSVLSILEKRLERKEGMTIKIASLERKIGALSLDPDVEDKLSKLSAEWVEYSGAIQQSKIKLKELASIVISDGECYTCHQKMESEAFDKLSADHVSNTDWYTKKKANSESRIVYLSELKKELEKQRDDNLTIDRSQSEVDSTKSQLLLLEEEISASEIEKEDLHNKMLDVKRRIIENERILMSLKNESFQSLHDEQKALKGKVISLSDEILRTGIKVGSLKEKTQSLSKKREELKSIKTTHDLQSVEMSVFDKMTKMFGKSGIQTLLLEAVIADLELTSNRILSSICSEQFSIELATQRAGSDGVSVVETLDLNVKKDGALCGFSSLSGGEQFRIALSLRIALSELATRHGGSSLEFLLLDEINSPLDKSGVETLFVNVIKQLETKYKILVITHDDSLKERFDNVLDVSKISGESTVVFSTNSMP